MGGRPKECDSFKNEDLKSLQQPFFHQFFSNSFQSNIEDFVHCSLEYTYSGIIINGYIMPNQSCCVGPCDNKSRRPKEPVVRGHFKNPLFTPFQRMKL